MNENESVELVARRAARAEVKRVGVALAVLAWAGLLVAAALRELEGPSGAEGSNAQE